MRFLAFVWLFLLSTHATAAIDAGHWHPGIGDPTWTGWLTVLVYFFAAFSTLRQYKKHRNLGLDGKLWLVLAALMVLLGINKQLDLQSWLTEVMKERAQMEGWYAYRRHYQFLFVAFVGIGMLIVLITMRLYLANSWRRFKLTWAGLVLLCGFIIIRMASFHHVDLFINQHVMGIKLNVMLELSALLLVILGTFYHKRIAPPIVANTLNVRNYVEIANEGDPVKCPNCGTPPLSKAVDGRQFKCRKCSHHYHVRKI
jgi:predicted RNA-binding Zn-ribbon protein involved in translation (DUF1610 family)